MAGSGTDPEPGREKGPRLAQLGAELVQADLSDPASLDRAFDDPDRFLGRDVLLASDVQSIDACPVSWREVTGRPPRRFPMPRWLFERLAGTDETTM